MMEGTRRLARLVRWSDTREKKKKKKKERERERGGSKEGMKEEGMQMTEHGNRSLDI